MKREVDSFFTQFGRCTVEDVLPWRVHTEADIMLHKQDHLQKLQARKEKATCMF